VDQLYPNLHHDAVVVKDINETGRDFGAPRAWALSSCGPADHHVARECSYGGRILAIEPDFGFIHVDNTAIGLTEPVRSAVWTFCLGNWENCQT
jgi:hypothetical protein